MPQGRDNHNNFDLGERLYRRCNREELEDPFDKVPLFDLSVNRSGTNNAYSQRDDVLFNTNPQTPDAPQKHEMEVAELVVAELNISFEYTKDFEGTRTTNEGGAEGITARIQLRHKLEECNYAHCAIEFYFNGEEVTRYNYSQTLGHKNRGIQKLRTQCRFEIARIILKRILRIHW